MVSPVRRHDRRFRQRGFTLHELVITVAMLAVILGLAVPTFDTFIANQRVRTATFDFTSALLLARSEATKRNTDVVVTALGAGWQDGWTVTAMQDGTNRTLMQHDPIPGIRFTTAFNSVTFRHNGRLAPGAGLPQFTIDADPSKSGVKSRCLMIDTGGKVNNEC